jgi:predicted kinase
LAPSLAFKELFARANARADADAASGSRSPLVVETTAGWESVRKDVLLLANAHQRPCHLLLLDASANVCARGRAQRERGFNPSKDVAEHYEYAWRQLLGDPERLLVEEGHRSVVVLDRRAANCLRAINFE